MTRTLLDAIWTLVRQVHPETLDRLEAQLHREDCSADNIRNWALELPQRGQREAFKLLVDGWKQSISVVTADAVLGAVAAHRFSLERQTKAEVCWSGPTDSLQGFRTTAAAYTELISSAKHNALVVTYSISEVEMLRASLEAAIEREVKVTIIIEDFDVFQQKSTREKSLLFGDIVRGRSSIYVWPTSRRRVDKGRFFGSMHVKALIVDDEALLLTSANWSAAAMDDNMELGAVIRDKEVVSAVIEHFNQFIANSVLVSLHEI